MNDIADRRSEEKERRRAEILDAVERVAADSGLDALTMDQVARQARLSRALIYVYFRDRDELLFGLCERGLKILRDYFQSADRSAATGIAKVRACGAAYVRFAREHPLLFSMLARFEAHTPNVENMAANESACVMAGDHVQQQLIAMIELGIADQTIRVDVGPPQRVAVTLWGFMHGVLQLASTKANVLAHYDVTMDSLVQQALVMCTRSIAGPAAPEEWV
jgi:AcrR family transcriptional regulator